MISYNSFKIVKTFEKEISHYTGALYAVAVNSCTNALFLCCKYLQVKQVEIPSQTFIGVPQSIIHAGGNVMFNKSRNDWKGIYQLSPYPIFDAAKRFTSNMYIKGSFMCLSFHHQKHLKIGRGGMILTDDPKAVEWFLKMRYFGREYNSKLLDDIDIKLMGYMMYMYPDDAARGLLLMQNIPVNNKDIIEPDGYRELTDFSIFKNCKVIDWIALFDI